MQTAKRSLCGKLADWVIVGGESGPGARPFCQDWALYLMSQCRDASTAFFMKQYGSNPWFERCNPNVTSWNDSTPTRIKLKSQAGYWLGLTWRLYDWKSLPREPGVYVICLGEKVMEGQNG